jgi:hypothetical protein
VARLFQGVRLEGLRNPRKTFGMILAVPAEIRTGYMSEEYGLSQLARYEAYGTKLSTAVLHCNLKPEYFRLYFSHENLQYKFCTEHQFTTLL